MNKSIELCEEFSGHLKIEIEHAYNMTEREFLKLIVLERGIEPKKLMGRFDTLFSTLDLGNLHLRKSQVQRLAQPFKV